MRRKDKEKDQDVEHGENVTYSEQSKPSEMLDREMALSLGRSIFMIHDPEFITWLMSTEDERVKSRLYNMYPAFSMLNRTANIGQLDKEILLLDYEFLNLINKLNMDEETYETEGWASSASMDIFARFLVNDSKEGWKGKLVTEQIKRIVTEIEKIKKKGILPF